MHGWMDYPLHNRDCVCCYFSRIHRHGLASTPHIDSRIGLWSCQSLCTILYHAACIRAGSCRIKSCEAFTGKASQLDESYCLRTRSLHLRVVSRMVNIGIRDDMLVIPQLFATLIARLQKSKNRKMDCKSAAFAVCLIRNYCPFMYTLPMRLVRHTQACASRERYSESAIRRMFFAMQIYASGRYRQFYSLQPEGQSLMRAAIFCCV